MEGSSKGWLWGLIIIIVLALGGWWYSTHNMGGSADNGTGPIKIGLIAPLTGDAATYGTMDQNGAQLAVKEINAAGGIAGRQVELTSEDGKCTGQDGSSAAQKLISTDGVRYIIGGGCSGETFAIVPIAEQAKVLVISPSASAPKLAGISPYFFRNNPNDNIPAVGLADYVAKTYKSVAVISEKTDYAQGFKAVFLSEAGKNNTKITDTEDYDPTVTDFRTVLLKMKSTNPGVIFINPQAGANLARVATQARQAGINTPLVSAVFTGPEVLSAGSAVEGMVLAVPQGVSTQGKGPEFLTKYKATYSADPIYQLFAGAGYDDVYLIKQGIEAVGNDPSKVAQYWHSLSNFDGVLGAYHFDQNGDPVGITSILQKIQNGKVVDVQ